MPARYRGVVVRRNEAGLFEGLARPDKGPRKSSDIDEALGELGPGEAIVDVTGAHANWGQDSRSMMVTFATPPPSHIVCRP